MINNEKKRFLSFSIDQLLSRDDENNEDNSTEEEENNGINIDTIETTKSSGDISINPVGKLKH